MRSAAVAAVRPVAVPAPVLVGPTAPLAVGGARSPLPFGDGCGAQRLGAVRRCGMLGGGVAVWLVPVWWTLTAAGLRLWRLKPNAVARLSHPPAVPKALGGSPGMRRKASNPVCSEACSPEGNVSKVPLGTLAAPVRLSEAGRARNLRTLEAPAPNATDARGTARGRRLPSWSEGRWECGVKHPAPGRAIKYPQPAWVTAQKYLQWLPSRARIGEDVTA